MSDQSPTLSEYRAASPVHVYRLQITVLVAFADEQEAYEELGKYASADSVSSIKTLVGNASVAGIQSIECTRSGPRQPIKLGSATLWGCHFWVEALVT